jgi:4-nitrophenyl phosphatase
MELELLAKIRCFLLDLDGTFYLGDSLLPGALDLVDAIQKLGLEFVFLTNNSSRHNRYYVEKIRRLGLEIPDDKVITSSQATAQYILQARPGSRVYIVGTPSLEETLESYGILLTDEDPDLVVLGFDTTLTYEKLWRLCDLVRDGIHYIATHHDLRVGLCRILEP